MKLIKAVTGNALVLASLVIFLAGGILATQASPGAANASSARLPAAAGAPLPALMSSGESAAAAAVVSELSDEIPPRSTGWRRDPRGSLLDALH